MQNIGTIGSRGSMKYILELTGAKIGTHNIVARLSSDKLELVSGEHEVLTQT